MSATQRAVRRWTSRTRALLRRKARQQARAFRGRFAPTKMGGHAREYPPLRWLDAGLFSMWVPHEG